MGIGWGGDWNCVVPAGRTVAELLKLDQARREAAVNGTSGRWEARGRGKEQRAGERRRRQREAKTDSDSRENEPGCNGGWLP